MTTVRAAPTRHRHTENLSGERCRYLPKQRPERRESWGQKTSITTASKSNESKMIDSCESTIKSLRPYQTPRPPHIRLVRETTGQHCLAFKLA